MLGQSRQDVSFITGAVACTDISLLSLAICGFVAACPVENSFIFSENLFKKDREHGTCPLPTSAPHSLCSVDRASRYNSI